MKKLAALLERAEPTIAAPFTSSADILKAPTSMQYVDVAELRADLFPHSEKLPKAIKTLAAIMPVLLTVRHVSESGGMGGIEDDVVRLGYYEMLGHQADGFDVEVNAVIRDQVIDQAKAAGKVAIASYHNFEITPSLTELEDILERGLRAGADYVKFALRANTLDDYQRQASFLMANRRFGLIAVAMDDPSADLPTNFGPLSRTFFPSIGSRLTYASLGEAIAPGQLTALEQMSLYLLLGYQLVPENDQ